MATPTWRFLRLVPLLIVAAAFPAAAQLPTGTGWFQIANSPILPLCPAGVPGATGCAGVTAAWNSGVFDQARNRLIIWGGGHNDYYGNEIYALDLNAVRMLRLTNPSTPYADDSCPESIGNPPAPNSRHTYDQITFIDDRSEMFVWGGSLACSNSRRSPATWVFNFGTSAWTMLRAGGGTGDPPADEGGWAKYDPVSRNVYVGSSWDGFTYRYDRTANTYTKLTNASFPFPGYTTAAVDTRRRRLYVVGNGIAIWLELSQSNPSWNSVTLSGCSGLLNANGPGFVYVPTIDRFVGWAGGSTVYTANADTNSCTTQSFSGGPTQIIGGQWDNGTYGRWQYSQASGVFVYFGNVNANAVGLRTVVSGPAPTPPSGLSAK